MSWDLSEGMMICETETWRESVDVQGFGSSVDLMLR